MSEFNLAFQLLIIGMISVFMILGLVVASGKLLIGIVNKLSPEPEARFTPRRQSGAIGKKGAIESKHLVVLSAVVESVTESKGVLQSVEKL